MSQPRKPYHKDGIVTGMDKDGCVLLWDNAKNDSFNSGDTVGEHIFSMTEEELLKCLRDLLVIESERLHHEHQKALRGKLPQVR